MFSLLIDVSQMLLLVFHMHLLCINIGSIGNAQFLAFCFSPFQSVDKCGYNFRADRTDSNGYHGNIVCDLMLNILRRHICSGTDRYRILEMMFRGNGTHNSGIKLDFLLIKACDVLVSRRVRNSQKNIIIQRMVSSASGQWALSPNKYIFDAFIFDSDELLEILNGASLNRCHEQQRSSTLVSFMYHLYNIMEVRISQGKRKFQTFALNVYQD